MKHALFALLCLMPSICFSEEMLVNGIVYNVDRTSSLICNNGAPVRYRDDGIMPTKDIGMLIDGAVVVSGHKSSTCLMFEGNLSQLYFIGTSNQPSELEIDMFGYQKDINPVVQGKSMILVTNKEAINAIKNAIK